MKDLLSYERFVDAVNTALASVASSSSLTMLDNTDADLTRQVAVLFRITQLAVSAVSRDTGAAASLLGLSVRCYEEQFAARVATEQGLVSVSHHHHVHHHHYHSLALLRKTSWPLTQACQETIN